MLVSRIWQAVLQYGTVVIRPSPISFSEQWQVLGPWQIGTREASWGADPLECNGGFRSLQYNQNTTFKSSLATNGNTKWKTVAAELWIPAEDQVGARLNICFPDVDWQGLRDVYGWAALQWQAWLRGNFVVNSTGNTTLAFYSPQILEFWIDEKHHFGGDFYGYGRAPIILWLSAGTHRIDVRLVRDIRAMGGAGSPCIDVDLTLERRSNNLNLAGGGIQPLSKKAAVAPSLALVSDYIGHNHNAILASPYASMVLRNDIVQDINVHAVRDLSGMCIASLLSQEPIKLVPGQSRPLAMRLECARRFQASICIVYHYRIQDSDEELQGDFCMYPQLRPVHEPQRVTYLHPGGIVSYAILRPPSPNVIKDAGTDEKLPILLGLHGAGVEAEDEIVAHSLDPLPDLPAWALFPTGVTPWSGDDWHAWGFRDVEAAISMITDWIEAVTWIGPGVDIGRWLVSGHSNGGQGTWYTLTHHPDKIIAAAPVSGYSSIQNYVPYTLWSIADPGRTAIVQSALNSYRNELLLANVKGIPILQQHGGADDNVPPYHSRLMSQKILEVGANSSYFEFSGKPHFWDGVMTTMPLSTFYEQQIVSSNHAQPLALDSFSVVSSNPGDTTSKHGLDILQLATPGQLGRIDVSFDPTTSACTLQIYNVAQFYMPPVFRECNFIRINEHDISEREQINAIADSVLNTEGRFHEPNWPRPFPARRARQLGAMDAILRTEGSFVIVRHSNGTDDLALQISRNLCQYFAADTHIIDDYEEAFNAEGNVVSVAVGDDLPDGYYGYFPLEIIQGEFRVRRWDGRMVWYRPTPGQGLAAIFLRPLPLGRLELVVWGVDVESLSVAARLVPMMAGVGQPDFVIADRSMLWKGLEGVHAMGFFDSLWNISKNAFFV